MSANPGALPGWYNRRADQQSEKNEQNMPTSSPGENPHAENQSLTPEHATTGGGQDDQTPVVVWEAANRLEAEIVAGRLHSQDIPAIIRGESLGAIYGLTTGSLAAATVLVPAPLAEKALEILATEVEWDDSDQDDLQDDLSDNEAANDEDARSA